MGLLDRFFTKTIYQLRRVGITGRALAPPADLHKLLAWHRKNELVYACVQTIADAAIEPRLMFQIKQDNGTWREETHPLIDLVHNPNPTCDESNLMTFWTVSQHIAGVFYAEIVRSRGMRQPVQLWPLHPGRLRPMPNESGKIEPIHQYEWQDGEHRTQIDHDKIFVDRNLDITNPFHGLPPLAVALGNVDMDTAQTDFVRAFFDNGGVPSGYLKISGKVLNERDKTRILDGWLKKYDRWGDYARGPAILDEAADYQRIGANLDELESQQLRMSGESRICGVFGVPPLLVYAVLGMAYMNQRASAKESHKDFWQNKMGPLFKRKRTWLEHTLLTEWERRDNITARRIRLAWDFSEVAALQEEVDTKLTRAREDFKAGAITLNQYLEQQGLPPDVQGDYYLRPINLIPVGVEQIAQQQEAVLYATQQAVLLGMTYRREPNAEGAEAAAAAAPPKTKADCGCHAKGAGFVPDVKTTLIRQRQDEHAALTQAIYQRAEADMLWAAETQLESLAPAQWAALLLRLPSDVSESLWAAANQAFEAGAGTIAEERAAAGAAPGFVLAELERAELRELTDTYTAQWLNEIQAAGVRMWGQPFYQANREAWRAQLQKEMGSASATWGAGLGRRACGLGRLQAQVSHGGKSRKSSDEDGSRCPKDGRQWEIVGWVFTYHAGEFSAGAPVCPQCQSWDGKQSVTSVLEPSVADVGLPQPGTICYRPYACNCSWHDAPICQLVNEED